MVTHLPIQSRAFILHRALARPLVTPGGLRSKQPFWRAEPKWDQLKTFDLAALIIVRRTSSVSSGQCFEVGLRARVGGGSPALTMPSHLSDCRF
jgi:hypothetical protein